MPSTKVSLHSLRKKVIVRIVECLKQLEEREFRVWFNTMLKEGLPVTSH